MEKAKENTKTNENSPWYHAPFAKIALAVIIFFIEQLTTSNYIFRETYATLVPALLINGILVGGLIYFMIWHNKKYHDQQPITIKRVSIKSVTYLLKILVITIIVNAISLFVMNSLHVINKTSGNQNNLDQLSNFNMSSYIFVLVLACIIAPVCEEFIFRYLPSLGTPNKSKSRKYWLIWFTILFVGCHLISDFLTLPLSHLNTYILIAIHAGQYAVTAFFLTSAYYKEGNMAVNMSTHALWNFSAAILSR